MALTKKTLDVLDAGISEKYDGYLASSSEMRERFFTESFWLDVPNWEKYYSQLSGVTFNWQEFRYADINLSNQINSQITTTETGIYMFYVKPLNLIFDMPKFILYIGIAGATGSHRPLRDRLHDYFNFHVVKKRNAVLRLLQKYYKNVHVAYCLMNETPAELQRIESALIGYFYPIANKDDFPVELKPIKKAF